MRRLLVGCAGLMLLGCAVLGWVAFGLPGSSAARPVVARSPLPFTPEGAILGHGFCGDNLLANAFRAPLENRVYGVRDVGLEEGDVAVVGVSCPDGAGGRDESFGYVFVRHDRDGMWRTSAFGLGLSPGPSPKGTVEYGADPYDGESTLVYGRVLEPEAAAVEVELDSGRALHGDTKGGVFALHAPGPAAPCELRVLTGDGQVLEEIDLARPGGDRIPPPNNCKP